ncbi:MAG TPA: hypothetical protein VGM56_33920 [Byssovorax sp.]|jgi:hypothetical protein
MKWLVVAAGLLAAPLAAFAACNADVTENCVSGPCTADAGDLSTTATSTGSGGASGAGGGGCAAPLDTIDDCDVASMDPSANIPCDIWAIMHRQPLDSGGCHKCHQNPPIGAPFPELTYSDLLQVSGYGAGEIPAHPDERVFQTMLKALQPTPPFPLTPMPFPTSEPLTCAEQRKLTNWLRGDGTPGGCAKPVPAGQGDSACCVIQGDDENPDAGCPLRN